MLSWLGIALILLMGLIYTEGRSWCKVKSASPLDLNRIPVNFERLKETAGVKRRIRVMTGPWITVPVVWGIIHPILLVPKNLSSKFTKTQIRWILLHELAHIRRWDTLVMLLQKILQSLFFFHPAVWLANGIMDNQREHACDDTALSGSKAPRRDCGEGFLKVVLESNGLPSFILLSAGMINHTTTTRKRLLRILDDNRKLHPDLSILGIVFITAMALVVLPYGGSVATAQADVVTEPLQQYGYGNLNKVSFSPDGQHIITAGKDGPLLWNISTGEVVRAFTGHEHGFLSWRFRLMGKKY